MSKRQTDAIVRRAERVRVLREKISELDREAAMLRAEKKRLEDEALGFLDKAGLESVSSDSVTVSVKETDVPQLDDFNSFWKFVRSKNAPELIKRSVNSAAWRDRGKKIPGVSTFTRKTLSVTKRK